VCFCFWIAASATILADSQQQDHPVQYRIIVFAVCLLIVLLGDSTKVMLAGNIREKLNPHNIHIINRISGIILIVFGVALMWGMITHKLPHSSMTNETSKAVISLMTNQET
jgi:small neutral amino acid transporter SnatA (MarC family)